MANQTRLDRAYMDMAERWALLSHAVRKQVGALVVKGSQIISDGFNGTPTGFPNACEGEDGETLPYVLHAESNALSKLARGTQSSDNATLYITLSPCFQCAKLIVQSGISRVVYKNAYSDRSGLEFLEKCDIRVEKITSSAEKDEVAGVNLDWNPSSSLLPNGPE